MFDPRSQLVVGLEIGTSKVCAVVGETGPNGLSIIGVGQARSRGVRKGEIVDTAAASEDVRTAIAEAEQMADAEIRSVYLGVSGAHVQGCNNRGRHNIPTHDREIMEEDIQDVVKNAKAINLPGDRHLIHVIRQHFIVDGQEGVINALGMPGAHLEVDVHVVHGLTNRLQTAIRVVKGLQLDVENIVFNGIASSLAVLGAPEKQQGALVIDLGAGMTDFAVYADGIIRHTGTLAVGGDHVSNDLAYGLKLAMGRAEALKLEHGSAVVSPETRGRSLALPGEPGLPERFVNLEHLHRVMAARIEETFEIIAAQIEALGLLDCPRAGVVLCGGGARAPQIDRVAERIFGLPVSLGRTKTISGLAATLDHPEFATAIGLVKFGSFQGQDGRSRPWKSRFRATLGSLTSAFRRY